MATGAAAGKVLLSDAVGTGVWSSMTTAGLADGAVTGAKIAQAGAASGQVLEWNGTSWAPAEDNDAGGTVTRVSATGPINVATGSTTPAITITQATAAADGYLKSDDFTDFSKKLAEVGLTPGSGLAGAGTGVNGLSPLRTCADSEVLKWNVATSAWPTPTARATTARGRASRCRAAPSR